MLKVATGSVKQIVEKRKGITYCVVEIREREEKAINFDTITGELSKGDMVVVNTEAVELGLGSGGYHFIVGVLYKFRHTKIEKERKGHIMKLRYTPYQFSVSSVEEDESPYKERLENFKTLDEMPVIVGTLLSQVAPASAVIKKIRSELKLAYIMTDSASLPIQISDQITELKKKGLIDATITCGQAFGGDYEAVNLWTGIITAKEVTGCDIAIITQGLGSVGTGTKFGFSGIEQGEIINMINILGGQPVAIVRISFADKRERHYGVSHHTLTVLKDVAITPCFVAIPEIDKERLNQILKKFEELKIGERHLIQVIDADITFDALKDYNIEVKTMGRDFEEDKEFFLSAGASGILTTKILSKRMKKDEREKSFK